MNQQEIPMIALVPLFIGLGATVWAGYKNRLEIIREATMNGKSHLNK